MLNALKNIPKTATGSYVLVIRNERPCKLKVGKLGTMWFPEGWYFYIGSAMGRGSTSLRNRLARHLRESSKKSLHWHIDHFLASPSTEIHEILCILSDHGTEPLECHISCRIQELVGIEVKHPNFGNSDCSHCQTHLYFASNYSLELSRVLQAILPESGDSFLISPHKTPNNTS